MHPLEYKEVSLCINNWLSAVSEAMDRSTKLSIIIIFILLWFGVDGSKGE